MEKKKRIEVVIPCYNEEECIPLIYQSIHEVAKKHPSETVPFPNRPDCSP